MLEICVGIIVGLVLGLTGAGGAVFAVPMFVLLLGFSPNDAMGASLGIVSISAMVGVFVRLNKKIICIGTAFAMLVGGALFAPVGRWLGSKTDETMLMIGFSILALFIASRMWRQARAQRRQASLDVSVIEPIKPQGWVMLGAGSATGLLSGLFGVGGGFFIVPILTLYGRMDMRRAAATSLLVIAVVSSSGFISHLVMKMMSDSQHYVISVDAKMSTFDRLSDWYNLIYRAAGIADLLYIALGAIIGMVIGSKMSSKVTGPRLQEAFAVSVIGLMVVSLSKLIHF
jgi:uncharacterized membrane protein YfcA